MGVRTTGCGNFAMYVCMYVRFFSEDYEAACLLRVSAWQWRSIDDCGRWAVTTRTASRQAINQIDGLIN